MSTHISVTSSVQTFSQLLSQGMIARVQWMNVGGAQGEQDLTEIRNQQIVRRSKRLRAVCGILTPEGFAKRKRYFVGAVCTSPLA